MKAQIVKPWEHITIKLKISAGWRYRWALGYWLIRAGSALIAHRVEFSVEGSDEPPALATDPRPGLERLRELDR